MMERLSGTLAIDLGNTNTVLAFQNEAKNIPFLVDIPEICKSPGIVPSALWYEGEGNSTFIGMKALNISNKIPSEKYFYSNFKRLIGNPFEKFENKELSPEESGEKFFSTLWDYLPSYLHIKRLVLTAPIDTYKGYRKWLIDICSSLEIDEIALVDEPTAAAIGIKIPYGSKIMVIDIGGSTIDLNIVKIEGGEGRAAPIAELLKFKGQDVSKISKQKLRCAEIISKSACKIGGKDIDRWIVNYFIPSDEDNRNLRIAENLKCRLSDQEIKTDQQYIISLYVEKDIKKDFYISKKIFEDILISNNLINLLNTLLKNLLNEARGKDCLSNELWSVILVGGGTQIPLIRNWITYKLPQVKIDYPPPIESIAVGALSLTPGVKIKDILNKSLLIRLFNKRENKHFWHPIFYKGQTWPTEKPFELILQASKSGQIKFEIIIGESQNKNDYDVIFENGIPKLAEVQKEEKIIIWNKKPCFIQLDNPVSLGKDCLKLLFGIDEKSNLFVECKDILDKRIEYINIGSIF